MPRGDEDSACLLTSSAQARQQQALVRRPGEGLSRLLPPGGIAVSVGRSGGRPDCGVGLGRPPCCAVESAVLRPLWFAGGCLWVPSKRTQSSLRKPLQPRHHLGAVDASGDGTIEYLEHERSFEDSSEAGSHLILQSRIRDGERCFDGGAA